MIKSGGYKSYPREIETVVEARWLSARWGPWWGCQMTYREAAHAILALRARSRNERGIQAWCARELANYKPRSFV